MVEPRLDPDVIYNETDLLAAAIHIDRYVMDAMERLDYDFVELNDLAMQTFKQLSRNKFALNEKVLNDKNAPGEGVTRNLEEITAYNELMEKTANSPKSRLQRLCACCERSLVFYSAIAESAADEVVRLTVQGLASSARERTGILKQALGGECGCVNDE